ncbi:MAG TPA: co-chaperone DjlA [Steroidobacteraceae bacterium]|nr:co-chaperone DjlA [Steroidobacteraceae bacterium]
MAQWTGKVVGGLLGALALGPFGAALGVLLGHQFDTSAQGPQPAGPALDSAAFGELFFRTTFQVMGHIAKAHGRVSEQDIEAARAVMAELRLNAAQVRAAIAHFTTGKERGFALDGAIGTLARACAGRPDLTRVFLEIQLRVALAGNDLDATSRALMQRIASRLGMSFLELAQMEAVLRIRRGSFARERARAGAGAELEQAYRVLGVEPGADDEEVAKAYRRQLSRHHPDKLKANGLPDSMIEHAKQRTQQIIEAYELVRERRGMAR